MISLFNEKARKTNLILTTILILTTMTELKNPNKVKTTESTTVHESKNFPFQIVEITTTNEDTKKESKKFRIGMCGQFISEKLFLKKETAEKYIASRPWELITNMVCVTFKMLNENENE